jgi:DNA-binding MarR family transcriptional regulator
MTATTPTERAETVASELMGVTAGIRRLVRRHIARSIAGPTLPAAQVDLLLVIEGEPGVGVAAAARTLHLAGNSVSALVNLLVSTGLVTRETDPADRRAAQLFLTPLATRRLTKWRRARAELVGRALDRIGAPERDAIEQAVPALRRLLGELGELSGLGEVGGLGERGEHRERE